MKYFSLTELTRTSQPYDNTPNALEVEHLVELTHNILDPIREGWGSPIRVNSGFRSEAVNKAVGGVSTSAHRLGYAADLSPTNGDFEGFQKFVFEWAQGKAFDQIIKEKNSSGSQWIHVGYKNIAGSQRQQLFSLNVNRV